MQGVRNIVLVASFPPVVSAITQPYYECSSSLSPDFRMTFFEAFLKPAWAFTLAVHFEDVIESSQPIPNEFLADPPVVAISIVADVIADHNKDVPRHPFVVKLSGDRVLISSLPISQTSETKVPSFFVEKQPTFEAPLNQEKGETNLGMGGTNQESPGSLGSPILLEAEGPGRGCDWGHPPNGIQRVIES